MRLGMLAAGCVATILLIAAAPMQDKSWKKTPGHEGTKPNRVIHAIGPGPVESTPGRYDVTTVELHETPKAGVGQAYSSVEIDCAKKTVRVTMVNRLGPSGAPLSPLFPEKPGAVPKAGTPMDLFRAAVCDGAWDKLDGFGNFNPARSDHSQFFLY